MKNIEEKPVLKHLSYSSIKLFRESPAEFKHAYIDGNKKEKTSAMALGSIVDCLLTEADQFEEKYAVRTVEPPSSPQQRAFVDDIVEYSINGAIPYADEVYKKHYAVKNKKEADIVEAAQKLFEKLKPYMTYALNLQQKGLIEISEDLFTKAQKIVSAILSHPQAKKWLVDMPGEYQKELYWNTPNLGIPILGYLDKIVYDHNNKRVLIIDLKCMSVKNEFQFARKAKQFWYYGQMWMYMTGMEQKLFNSMGERYTIDHLFVVVNSEEPHQVICVKLDSSDLERGAVEFYEAVEKMQERQHSNSWAHSNKVVNLKLFYTPDEK